MIEVLIEIVDEDLIQGMMDVIENDIAVVEVNANAHLEDDDEAVPEIANDVQKIWMISLHRQEVKNYLFPYIFHHMYKVRFNIFHEFTKLFSNTLYIFFINPNFNISNMIPNFFLILDNKAWDVNEYNEVFMDQSDDCLTSLEASKWSEFFIPSTWKQEDIIKQLYPEALVDV